jgi:hypothetical protein
MKKAIKAAIILSVVLAAFVFTGTTALASQYDAQADALHELGLFLGTDRGYELDRTSTRAEAAVMLIRLLGEEAEVEAGSYTHPFTDVPAWADSYIGYMYENGLTNGTSATTFGALDDCDARMFTAFVLRSLGYTEEGGDFSYAEAQDFGVSIGLSAGYDASDAFLRDDMAALSYSALFQQLNDESGSLLLERLVADSAVDATAASKYLRFFETYLSYMEASAKTQQNTRLQVRSVMDADLTIANAAQEMTQTTDCSFVLNGSDFIMKQDSVTELMGTTTAVTSYYKDGWLYMDTESGKFKYPAPIDISALIEQTGLGAGADPFYLFESIEKTQLADGTGYKMAVSASTLNGMLDALLSQYLSSFGSGTIEYRSAEVTVDFDANGNMRDIKTVIGMSMEMTVEGQTVTAEAVVDMTATIVATGSAVSVTLPSDLDTYVEYTADTVTP